jgi:hypothetical protein
MQKALDQMNLQLHHVISDITGMTGIRCLSDEWPSRLGSETLRG